MKRYETAEAKWAASTQPTDDGHLLWTGSQHYNGTPIFDFRRKRYQAVRSAFTIRTGRDPVGSVRNACDEPLCVHPRHVHDEAERMKERALLRLIEGYGPRPAQCAHGHDQTAHGRYRRNGQAYCNLCNQATSHRAAA